MLYSNPVVCGLRVGLRGMHPFGWGLLGCKGLGAGVIGFRDFLLALKGEW